MPKIWYAVRSEVDTQRLAAGKSWPTTGGAAHLANQDGPRKITIANVFNNH